MSAIIVENLGKCYQIGHQVRHDTLRDALVHKLARLSPFGKHGPRLDREDFWALRDVSFRVEPGEVVGIVGRNGAGKSTLLKILSRITEPTVGKIRIKGRVASLLEVGTGFHPELSGRENIYLNGAILGMSRAEIRKKFDEIVAFSEVGKFLDTPVKRYSSGMYVRLAFSVAAHLDPEILIVDEVLAVGDAQFQKKCLSKMQQVSKSDGRTILFVSHNTAAVASLCTKGALLEHGRLSQYGPVSEIVGAYFSANSLKTGYVTLGDRPPANGIKISSVELLDHRKRRSAVVENGRAITVRIGFHRAKEFGEPVIPSFRISTASGTPVCHHHSRLNKDVFSALPTSGFFDFKLDRLPIAAESYLISPALVSGNRILDEADRVLGFDVIDGPYYSPGETTPASHGILLIDGEWSRSSENICE